jgi:hypothetical protein
MKPIFEDVKNFNCQDLYLLTVGTGNSALEPIRVFSRADAREQLHVRIDDKLSRIMRGTEYVGDNDIDDLIGYLVLLKIAKAKELEKQEAYGHVD